MVYWVAGRLSTFCLELFILIEKSSVRRVGGVPVGLLLLLGMLTPRAAPGPPLGADGAGVLALVLRRHSPHAMEALAVITASRTFRMAADWSALGGVHSTMVVARCLAASRILT